MSSKSDYYSEEKTLQAPSSKKKPGTMGGGDKLFGRELRDYEDKDIESLLSNLTTEELQDLNNDFDPDRCKDQTNKAPTGAYSKEKLLKYLEDSAKSEKDWEEAVPYSAGTKRGKVYEPKEGEEEGPGSGGAGDKKAGKGEMQMPIEIDLPDSGSDGEEDEHEEEDEDEEEGEEAEERQSKPKSKPITDRDLDRALDNAPERDLVDLAGILGMHNVLNQQQYYNALKGKTQDAETGLSFNGIIKAYQPRVVPDEPENQTDVEEVTKRLEAGDSQLEEVNINNMKRVSKERIRSMIRAAGKSPYLKKLALANTAISDSEARPLVELLQQSESLRVLNIESNFISPEMIAQLLRATLVKQTLVEFHAENQRASVLGNQIEMDIMLSVEDNDSLLRVGVSLQSMEARHRVSEALERNYERLRLKRLENSRAKGGGNRAG